MFKDLFPVQMTVFGIDDNPIQPQRHSDLREAGRFQSNPKTEGGFIRGQFLAQPLDGGNLHERGETRPAIAHVVMTLAVLLGGMTKF